MSKLAAPSDPAQTLLQCAFVCHWTTQEKRDSEGALHVFESEVEAAKHLILGQVHDVILGEVLDDGFIGRVEIDVGEEALSHHIFLTAYDHPGALRLRSDEMRDARH